MVQKFHCKRIMELIKITYHEILTMITLAICGELQTFLTHKIIRILLNTYPSTESC